MMRRLLLSALFVLALLVTVTACNPVGALNAVASGAGLKVSRDLAYGPDPRNVLDLYRPSGPGRAPLVLFIHGGSWARGDKDQYRFVGDSLGRAGYVTAVMSYRLAPAHRYPAFIQDAALALRWLRDHAARYGADPDRLFVVGHSAGAFNAVELVDNARWLAEAGVPVSAVRGVVGIAGPYSYDYRPLPSAVAFPAGSRPEQTMPSYHVSPHSPPNLLLVAGKDSVVNPSNGVKMEAALRAAGVPVTLTVIPGLTHYTVLGALARPLSFLGPTRRLVLDFLAARR